MIENDLFMLPRQLTCGLDELEKQQVKRFLKDLGVKDITPSELINEHIIQCFKDEKKWKVCKSSLREHSLPVHYVVTTSF